MQCKGRGPRKLEHVKTLVNFSERPPRGGLSHWAEGQFDRLLVLATDLVHQEVSLIFAGGGSDPDVAKAATSKIPIVFANGTDPVEAGLVGSLEQLTSTANTRFTEVNSDKIPVSIMSGNLHFAAGLRPRLRVMTTP